MKNHNKNENMAMYPLKPGSIDDSKGSGYGTNPEMEINWVVPNKYETNIQGKSPPLPQIRKPGLTSMLPAIVLQSIENMSFIEIKNPISNN